MNAKKDQTPQWWHHHLTFSLGLMMVAFFLFFLSSLLEAKLPSVLLDHLGAALLIVGGFGIYEKWVSEKKFLEQISGLFGLSVEIRDSGISSVLPDPRDYDFRTIIRKSNRLSMVFNDGRRWISEHFTDFDARFQREDQVTELFVLNPESPSLDCVAAKNGDDPDTTREKVATSTTKLVDAYDAAGRIGELRIFFVPCFPTHSVILGDDKAVITLYTISSGKSPVPTIEVVENDTSVSLFDFIQHDLELLRNSSTLAFDSTAPEDGPEH